MTISTTTIKNSYSANSSTVTFNYTFKIAADTEIEELQMELKQLNLKALIIA